MSSIFKYMYLGLILLTVSFSHAGHTMSLSTKDAIGSAITPDSTISQVTINGEDIFIQVGDHWIAVKGLQTMPEGTFVLIDGEWIAINDALTMGEYRRTWKCTKCHFINYEGIEACAVCGKPRNA